MRLKDETYEYIKQVVIDNFIYYKIRGIPINPFEIAITLGITIIPYSALSERARELSLKTSVDGYSVPGNDGSYTIYYNDKCRSYGRVKNTIMHEIAHFLLGHTQDGPSEEAEANFFAKYALAPPPLIHNMRGEINPHTITEVFQISVSAALNAFDYYQKWFRFGGDNYTEYEIQLLELFEVA